VNHIIKYIPIAGDDIFYDININSKQNNKYIDNKKLSTKHYHNISTYSVRGDPIRAMDANVTNAVLGTNSAIPNFMNDPSVALVAFNQRDIFVKLM